MKELNEFQKTAIDVYERAYIEANIEVCKRQANHATEQLKGLLGGNPERVLAINILQAHIKGMEDLLKSFTPLN